MATGLLLLGRVALGLLFVYSGVVKLINPTDFFSAVSAHSATPLPVAQWTVAILPFAEIIGGLGVLCGFYRRGSALVLALLLVVFSLYLISILLAGDNIPCGCFGTAEPVSAVAVVRNASCSVCSLD